MDTEKVAWAVAFVLMRTAAAKMSNEYFHLVNAICNFLSLALVNNEAIRTILLRRKSKNGGAELVVDDNCRRCMNIKLPK